MSSLFQCTYLRVPTESRIYTCASNRYFGSPRTSRTCYRAPCCRHILPFASLLASVRNNADRLVKSESSQPVVARHDTQKDGASLRSSSDALKSCFALLDTVTGPPHARSLSRETSSREPVSTFLPRCSRTDYQLSIRFERRIQDTKLLFSRAPFLNEYHANKRVPLSTGALSDRNNPLDTSTSTSTLTVCRPREEGFPCQPSQRKCQLKLASCRDEGEQCAPFMPAKCCAAVKARETVRMRRGEG
jgi:hypothetical protein